MNEFDDEGEGSGRAAFTWLDLGLLLGIVAVASALLAPTWARTRKARDETNAVNALKTITTGQSLFRESDSERDGNLDYGMLSELSNVSLVDSVLGSGTKSGYLFEVSYSFTTSEFLWYAVANRSVPSGSGDKSFVTSAAGVIFYTTRGILALDTATCTLPLGVATSSRP